MYKKKGYVLINRREGQSFVVYPVSRKNDDTIVKVKLIYVDECCVETKLVLSLSDAYRVFNEQQDGSREEAKPKKTDGKNKRGVIISRKEGESFFLTHNGDEIEVLLNCIREYHNDGERAGWVRFAIRDSRRHYVVLREELLDRARDQSTSSRKKPVKRFKNLD